MAGLQDLINQIIAANSQEILSPEQKAARVQQIASAGMPAMQRQYANSMQNLLENTFARGMAKGPISPTLGGGTGSDMGLSPWLAQQVAALQAQQSEAGAKIQSDAQTAVDAAQRAAIGNANSYTSGELNRQAQAREANRNRQQATSLQNRSMLYGGLGNLAMGGLGVATRDLTRPAGQNSALGSAYDRLKGLLPGGGQNEQVPNLSNPQELNNASYLAGAQVPEPEYNPPDISSGGDIGGGAANAFGGIDWGNMPNVQVPDFGLDSLLNWTTGPDWSF